MLWTLTILKRSDYVVLTLAEVRESMIHHVIMDDGLVFSDFAIFFRQHWIEWNRSHFLRVTM